MARLEDLIKQTPRDLVTAFIEKHGYDTLKTTYTNWMYKLYTNEEDMLEKKEIDAAMNFIDYFIQSMSSLSRFNKENPDDYIFLIMDLGYFGTPEATRQACSRYIESVRNMLHIIIEDYDSLDELERNLSIGTDMIVMFENMYFTKFENHQEKAA